MEVEIELVNGAFVDSAHLHCDGGAIIVTLFSGGPTDLTEGYLVDHELFYDGDVTGMTCDGTVIDSLASLEAAMAAGLVYGKVHIFEAADASGLMVLEVEEVESSSDSSSEDDDDDEEVHGSDKDKSNKGKGHGKGGKP